MISTNSLQVPILHKLRMFNPRLQLAVLASGTGTNFENIVKATLSGQLTADIRVLIVNNPNSPAILKAKKYSIDSIIINHNDFKSRLSFDQEIINHLEPYNVEGLLMAGWMRIVSNNLISKYPERIVNIHPSLLPSFPGINSIKRSIDSGCKITGCSVHLVVPEVDSGKILIQSAVAIDEYDDEVSLRKKIQIEEHKIFPIGISIAAEAWRLPRG